MNPLLEQFISEARDFLQGIGEKLMQLESDPNSTVLMTELFRLVHTLKGNTGLFEFPEMMRVLHAGEDLLDAVRDGRVAYSQPLADRLLEAMDFVNFQLDEIEARRPAGAEHAQEAVRMAQALRQLLGTAHADPAATADLAQTPGENLPDFTVLAAIPEQLGMEFYRAALESGEPFLFVEYIPEEECFFKGEDPFFQARHIPEAVWHAVRSREAWPSNLAEMDPYRCQLVFYALAGADAPELHEFFRYTPEQVRIAPILPVMFALPQGDPNGGPVYDDFVADALGLLDSGNRAGLEAAARTMLELSASGLWLSSALRWLLLILELEPGNHRAQRALIESLRTQAPPAWPMLTAGEEPAPVASAKADGALALPEEHARAFGEILLAQREILSRLDDGKGQAGRLRAVAATLAAGYGAVGRADLLPTLDTALAESLTAGSGAALLAWLDEAAPVARNSAESASIDTRKVSQAEPAAASNAETAAEPEVRFGRRAEEAYAGPRTLKVDQVKIDRLMGLIGEMVVAKNSLPYLASRAETQYGVRELSRDIKTQYAVINRIAEEMQDAIMQVRMMPVSFIFQRFPRLVRDTSRKLGKEVNLVLEGENTEADKNIVEALADPLIHIVRNSLDHGIERAEVRRAAGKPEAGRLTIRASQESDRVYIEICDDGKGIDPQVVKRKAYEKGIIDEAALERLSDKDAVNLVFAPGFSTAETISDLSGRGVGMDVVRSAVEKVNGTVTLESEVGKGTRIRLSLPLSMAVTNVMIIESDKQIFGVPMDVVVETVRVPRSAIRTIKKRQTTVLRGHIVPLLSLNTLLAIDAEQRANDDDELATLVVRIHGEHVGILVDDFRETVDIILKPMAGILGGLGGYAGSALLGDGSVLMILNPVELV